MKYLVEHPINYMHSVSAMHDIPLEIVRTRLRDAILKYSHRLHHLLLDLWRTLDLVVGQEMLSDGDQSVFGPSHEPIHSTPGDETGELQGTTSELFANLVRKKIGES